MHTSFPRVVAALIALAFVLAACASDSGSEWTFAPATASADDVALETPAVSADPEAPTELDATEPAATEAPAEPETPAATAAATEPDESAQPATPAAGEARVIDLQADSALRFTDDTGQPVPEIAVTPGETVVFRIDNTAGFAHNFWIGLDGELSVPGGSTDAGLADWSTGVQELEWVVPDDISDLKFACTVPGHYYTMQGTFALADATEAPAEPTEPEVAEPAAATEAPAEPETPAATAAPTEPDESAQPATPAAGEARVIELEADSAIRFLQDGEQIRSIEVTPGETVVFRVDNTAGFAHNFYIGADDNLSVMGGTTDVGIPDWDTGVQELEWVVPDDPTGIRFACTVPGHYYTMQGDFTVTP